MFLLYDMSRLNSISFHFIPSFSLKTVSKSPTLLSIIATFYYQVTFYRMLIITWKMDVPLTCHHAVAED